MKQPAGWLSPRRLRASAEKVPWLLRKEQKQQVAGFIPLRAWWAVSASVHPVVTVLPFRWRWLTTDPSGAILWLRLAWLNQALVYVKGAGGRGRRTRPLAALAPRRGRGWLSRACRQARPATGGGRGRAVAARGQALLFSGLKMALAKLW